MAADGTQKEGTEGRKGGKRREERREARNLGFHHRINYPWMRLR